MDAADAFRPSLSKIPTFDDHGRVLIVIETPLGSPNKLKYEPSYGAFRLTRILPIGMSFPFNFGFVPGTCAEDGDPLDVLVLADATLAPGCIVPSRLIGVIEAEQREHAGEWTRNDRILAAVDGSPIHGDLRGLDDLNDALVAQIEAFFANYNHIDGREFRVRRHMGPRRAEHLVRAGIARA